MSTPSAPPRPQARPQTTVAPAPLFHNVLEMVGNTPMLELSRLGAGPCRLFAKLELANPAGSIKDRIGVSMIEAAEREGVINPAADPRPTLVEATAGNTGLGLALVAGQRGYKLIVVVPDKMSREKIQHLRAMGAEVLMTRSDVQKGHPEYYQEVAAKVAQRTPNSLYVNQFANKANADAHYRTTGPEMWRQLESVGLKLDALIVGVGSGGTLTGCGRFLREKNPDVKLVLADPAGSMLHPLVNEGKHVQAGSWLIEGMGEDFVPSICDIDLCDEAIPVTDAEAFLAARELLAKEGVLAGSSTGCLIHAALVWCRRQTRPLNVVTFVCDSGAKYLSKVFNDAWLMEQGFLKRPTSGDLRDLIARRHDMGEDYTLRPTDPLKQAVTSMKLYDVSQLAVLDASDKLVGIIDESDVLMALTSDPSAFKRPVGDFMTSRVETIPPSSAIKDLIPIFRADRVAIVVGEGGAYLGLVTKIDLINYLRRQMPV